MNFEDSLQEYENIGILKKNTFLDELEQICNKYPDKYAVICKFCSNGTPILKSAVHSF